MIRNRTKIVPLKSTNQAIRQIYTRKKPQSNLLTKKKPRTCLNIWGTSRSNPRMRYVQRMEPMAIPAH